MLIHPWLKRLMSPCTRRRGAVARAQARLVAQHQRIEPLETRVLLAGVAELVEVADINPIGVGSNPSHFTDVNGTLYFTANDATFDRELWRINGSGAAELVEDAVAGGGINPGGNSNPYYLTNVNGTLYFNADDGTNGRELWRINGSGAAELVEYAVSGGGINPGESSYPRYLTNVNGTLYFTANYGTSDRELWRLNGSGLAELVEDAVAGGGINPVGSSDPRYLTNVNGTLYFSANDGTNGVELWRINDSGAAEMVEDVVVGGGINPGEGSYPRRLANVNGTLYFSADDGPPFNNIELWRINSSGVAELVEDAVAGGGINPGASSIPEELTNVNGTLYFSANDGTNGYELWRINGSGVAELVEDAIAGGGINPGENSNPYPLTNVNGTLYFSADDGTNGRELWRINGSGVAELVEDAMAGGGINPGGSSYPNSLTNVNGTLYFTANDGTNGYELWRINGSGAAELVEDAVAGGGVNPNGNSFPSSLTNVNSTLYFRANDGTNGQELWRINGSGVAELVEDAMAGGGINPGAGSNPYELTNVNGTLYFRANDGTNGFELWRINGSGVAELVEDAVAGGGINSRSGSLYPLPIFSSMSQTSGSGLIDVNGIVYFVGVDDSGRQDLWRINGSGIVELVEDSIPGRGLNIFTPFGSIPSLLTNVNGTLYFTFGDGVTGPELWRINSTGVAELVEDEVGVGGIQPGPNGSNPLALTNVNGTLYFSAYVDFTDAFLWRINDSGIAEPVENSALNFAPLRYLTNVSGTLYFTADDGVNGEELWRINSNGAAELVEDGVAGGGINPGLSGSVPRYLTNVNGTLYFSAFGADAGAGIYDNELWRINASGIAEPVEDGIAGGGINAGDASSFPRYLTDVSGTLYFTAIDDVNGEQLWRINSDGVAELVEDGIAGGGINAGDASPFPRYLTDVSGTLYFTADDGITGRELWRINSNGGAELVEDGIVVGSNNPDSNGPPPNLLTNVSGTLYFTANDGVNGTELWRINRNGAAELVEDGVAGGGINPGEANSDPRHLTNVNGTLYFSASDGTNGIELWRINDNGIAELAEDGIAEGGINPGDASSYPRFLTNLNGTLYFTADDGINGPKLWRVSAVLPPNHAPTVANGIPDQSATEDVAFTFTFAANAFADVDEGDSLTFTAEQFDGSALPSWLTFTAETRTFSGTPGNADLGIVSINVTATDNSNASVSDTFEIGVFNDDFGDAPDLGDGTGTGDYQTSRANGGPSHLLTTTRTTLFLGAGVDSEADATPNKNANGDDSKSSPDDENGLIEPAQDLVLTVGTAPMVRLRATNTTGSAATLYGWIDFNRDGVFDNATERTSVTVPDSITNGTFTLTFPTIPTSTTAGTTYARFRLSTDVAAANSTGAATGGEVEDYAATITQRSSGKADSTKSVKITGDTDANPILADGDRFGRSVTSLGDFDGDGVTDLAVGAYDDDTNGTNRGAVHVLLLNANGTVKSSLKIASDTNGGPTLEDFDSFGTSVAALGDLDGDGVTDLAVGAYGDDTGSSYSGAVHVLLLNPNGTVKSSVKIASETNGGPLLAFRDFFGFSVTSLGDLDADGITDLAVGAHGDDTEGTERGAVHVLLLNSDGTVKNSVRIASDTNGGPTLADADFFGRSVASLGDLDGDGVTDLAVGARGDDTGGSYRGAVHVLLLNSDGTVKDSVKIASDTSGGPTLADGDYFGRSVASLGDLNGDGVTDLAVGVYHDGTGDTERGAVHVLLLNSNGTVNSSLKIASGLHGGPALADRDSFGSSMASLGDLDGDGVTELAVGARYDGTGGNARGAVHVLFLNANGSVKDSEKIVSGTDTGPALSDYASFGSSVATLGDLDGDGVTDLAVGANPGVGLDGGAVHVVFLNADGTFKNSAKIAANFDGGETFGLNTYFGQALTSLGDLDGDGVTDLAVGAFGDSTEGTLRGAVHVLLLNADGTRKASVKIASGVNGGPMVADRDFFGSSVASLGDLDGDGVIDLAVGATGDDTGGSSRGAVHVLFMNADGSVKSSTKIADNMNGGPTLANSDFFGGSVTSLGDLDGDGVTDLVVGATGDDTGGTRRGALYVLLLNADGTAKGHVKIADNTSGGPVLADNDFFGFSVASLGDLNGDGVTDLAVGAEGDDTGGSIRGAVYLLSLNANGTVKSRLKIANNTNGGPTLADVDFFGTSVASLGDLNGDGLTDLAVGALGDDTGGSFRGAVHVLFLKANHAPTLQNAIANQNATIESAFSFQVAADTFTDVDADDSLTYSATLSDGSGLPNWLTFTAETRTFSGTPQNDDGGRVSIKVTATDSGSLSVSDEFDLAVITVEIVTSGGTATIGGTGTGGGAARNDQVMTALSDDGQSLVLTIGGVTTEIPLAGLTELVFNGGGGDDALTIDLSQGVLPFEITFDGGVGGNDSLIVDGFDDSGAFNAYTADYTNRNDGGLRFRNGNSVLMSLNYLGLEPITIDGTPTDVIFNLPDTNDPDVRLLDIGGADGFLRLIGSTFETTDFSISAATTSITINSNGGNDRVTIQSLDATFTGAVIVDGGAGNDTLIASSSNRAVTLFGGLGKDTLTGSAFGDSLDGGASNDLLTAGAGNDSLMGGAGNDMLDGGTGTDMVSESANANFTLLNAQLTGNGTDKLSNIEQAMLTGGASSNLLDASFFTLGNVTLLGGDGSDTLLGSAFTGATDADEFNDSLNGGAGIDVGRQSSRISQRLTVSPTPGTNVITGVGSDLWTSIEGLHFIGTGSTATTLNASAFAGSVTLAGGSGNDVLFGGSGPNSLNGNAGHDVLTGGDDTDTLSGGTGNDILVGNGGDDVLNGQTGNDTLRGHSGNDRMFGDVGNDKLFGGDGRDFLDGGAGEDVLTGEVGDDSINGGAGQDAISGGEGDDVLNGGLGNDTILGGSGNDVLRSEGGADRLSGGSGDDRFVATSSRISLGGGDDTVSGSNNKIDAVFVFDFEKLLL